MSVPEVQQVKPLATPDPILTSEALVVAVVALISNVYVLFLSHDLTDAQKNGIAGLITGGWLLGQFFYSAYIRASRAKAGGLLNVAVHEVQVASETTGNPPTDTGARPR